MKAVTTVTTLILGLSLLAGSANATVFSFDLYDSVEGNTAPPTYGLRLDGLYSGNAGDIYTFSFVDVGMTVDSDADTATLGGTLSGGTSGNGEARTTDWAFAFTYTGLDVDATDGSWEFINGTSDGSGTIWSDDLGDSFLLVQWMGSDGFGPKGDGGPCRTDDGPWCGNGWLNHSITPNTPTTGWENTHLAASDFLYTGVPVPEPSVLALFAAGLIGFGTSRRRNK